jgi:hypothetical protein
MLLGLLLAPAACLEGNPVVGGSVERCTADSECPGASCDRATQRCLSRARAEVFFAVTPATGRVSADAFPTLTRPRSILADESVDLALRAPRVVYGVVTVPADADAAGRYIPATLEFTPSDLAGVSPPVQAVAGTMAIPNATRDRDSFTWSATLTEGLFDVLVRPASTLAATVPPRFERGFEVRGGAVMQRFDIAYPTTYARWAGLIETAAGQPVAGFAVRAVDPAANNRVLSTVSSTAGDGTEGSGGRFACSMAPGAPEAWTLRLSADNGAGGGLMIDIPRAALVAAAPSGRDLRVVLPELTGLTHAAAARPVVPGAPPPYGPCVDCVDVRASVEGLDPDGQSRSMGGATVTLRAAMRPPVGIAAATSWYESRAVTEADGSFRAWLVPGDYDVVVTPAGEAFRSAVQHGFRVRSDVTEQAGQVFTLERRPSLAGRVLGRDGLAVRGARVTAVPYHDAAPTNPCLADPDLRALASRATTTETVTSTDGSYQVDLNPGLYRLLVEPAESSGFPVTLGAPVCVARRVSNFDTTLEAPVQVRGVVRDARGMPSPLATVEALVRLREGDAPGVVLRVARATADANGNYRLLIPASAAGSP